MKAILIGSELYRMPAYAPPHPLAIPRVSVVIDLARALGWLDEQNFRTSPQASPAQLIAFHAPHYVGALINAEKTQTVDSETRARFGLGTFSNPVFPLMFRRPATAVGGALLAAELSKDGARVFVPGAGNHHALPDRAQGFCYLNDPVLCLLHLKRLGYRRIAYVDIDAHHMDAVEQALAGDPTFLLISTHEEKRWPFTGALADDGGGNVVNIPLPAALNDSEFAAVREGIIRAFLELFEPEIIVAQCGADALAEDPLSRLALSNRAYLAHVALLTTLAPRLILLGGGGYHPFAVVRTWTAIWGFIAGFPLPDQLPKDARAILQALNWKRRRGKNPPPSAWSETLVDAPHTGALRPSVLERIEMLRKRLPLFTATLARLAERTQTPKPRFF